MQILRLVSCLYTKYGTLYATEKKINAMFNVEFDLLNCIL